MNLPMRSGKACSSARTFSKKHEAFAMTQSAFFEDCPCFHLWSSGLSKMRFTFTPTVDKEQSDQPS